MTYYNALVYTEYGTVIPYHSISRLNTFLSYQKKYVSYTKIFLYRLPNRTAKKGVYCAYHYANQIGFTFKN